ncbi:HP1 family phage holin [Paraburkholderia sp. SIMBA_027]|uniref:HP1 family phage holin n=1 Tax=Paraburkholderia sp. SIMBA_027 TaxID=3085770 RepID=UPI00397E640C
MKITSDAAASYGGAAVSLAAGWSLSDYASIVGIMTAVVTCLAHLYFSWKRSRDYERVADARVAEAKSHTAREPGGAPNG